MHMMLALSAQGLMLMMLALSAQTANYPGAADAHDARPASRGS